MKNLHHLLLTLTAMFGSALIGHATIIVDNTWADGIRTNWNLPAASPWYTWTTGSQGFMGVETNALYCTNTVGVTRYFWTYFTSNAPELTIPYLGGSVTNTMSNNTNAYYGYPVDIDPGQMVQVTLKFMLSDVLPSDNNVKPVRLGLLDYDTNNVVGAWQGRVIRDTSNITKSGTNVTGYRINLPMFQSYPGNALLGFLWRSSSATNSDDCKDPLGKDSVWTSLGSGPSLTNWTGFQAMVPYTLVWSIARYAASNVLTATLSGAAFTNLDYGTNATSFTHEEIDDSGTNWHRFDSCLIRFDTQGIAADVFIINEFKVEVLPAPLSITLADRINADNFRLRWTSYPNFNYQVQSKDDLNASSWTTYDTVTATTHATTWTNTGTTGISQRFYRVVNTP
jgi:hypothetical protein